MSKNETDAYKNFHEGDKIEVEVHGIIYVPNKLVAGYVFPKYVIDNKYPHMTVLLNQWPAVNSNMALESSCKEG